jgi:hypothetical protein
MFSPKMMTTCLIGVAVGVLSDSALAAAGMTSWLANIKVANDVAMYFCITAPPWRRFFADLARIKWSRYALFYWNVKVRIKVVEVRE